MIPHSSICQTRFFSLVDLTTMRYHVSSNGFHSISYCFKFLYSLPWAAFTKTCTENHNKIKTLAPEHTQKIQNVSLDSKLCDAVCITKEHCYWILVCSSIDYIRATNSTKALAKCLLKCSSGEAFVSCSEQKAEKENGRGSTVERKSCSSQHLEHEPSLNCISPNPQYLLVCYVCVFVR